MKVVPLGPERVKLTEINNFERNWQYIQSKVNNRREETIVNNKGAETLKEVKKEQKRTMKIKHIVSLRMNQQLLYSKKKFKTN